MQGDFLAEVFGDALGYAGFSDDNEVWHRERHFRIGDETADAALGFFRQTASRKPLVVIELKGPKVHLDRDRSNGRTAVAQCWDYLVNTPPECRWGIVSNIVSFRLYERASTKRAYEHFSLQSLRDFDLFKQFYVLFHRQGLSVGPADDAGDVDQRAGVEAHLHGRRHAAAGRRVRLHRRQFPGGIRRTTQ
jgi:hypothetical protein